MKRFIVLCILVLAGFEFCSKPVDHSGDIYTPPPLSGTTWAQFQSPGEAGWSLEKLSNAYHYAKMLQTEAVVIVYRGKILYYWGNVRRKIWTHSSRKSFMSALYGVYAARGTLNLNWTMGELGIDDSPPGLSDQEKTATVRMLLQARSGVYHEAAAEAAWMKETRPARQSHAPGTFWYYNNWDFNVLGTIFNRKTGKDFFQELHASILAPIGCEDFVPADGVYSYENVSIHPAYPFRITALDMARFGLLMLRKGEWEGQRIIPEAWATESTTSYSDIGEAGGYGYMWWVAVHGKGNLPGVDLPDGSYSAQGAYGQYCVVIPQYDLVVVHRVNSDVQNVVSGEQFGMVLNMILEARPR